MVSWGRVEGRRRTREQRRRRVRQILPGPEAGWYHATEVGRGGGGNLAGATPDLERRWTRKFVLGLFHVVAFEARRILRCPTDYVS